MLPVYHKYYAQVNIQFEGRAVCCTVDKSLSPSQIILASGLGITSADNYVLKILGKEEYLVEEVPISEYKSLLEDVLKTRNAFLVLKKRDDVMTQIASDDVYSKLAEYSTKRRRHSVRERQHG